MKDDLLDAVVDGWKILIKVGQGASGSVYEARKDKLRAALKVIRPDAVSENSVARFKREAHLLMEIDHPHVVHCLGAGESGDFIYLALEFLDGGSLETYLQRRKRFPVPVAVGIVRSLLDGVSAIHEKEIVHRDIKPANVLLDAKGTVKLADFNLARSEQVDMNVTSDGTIVGTPFYMAPEQVENKDLGPPTDLYAVGAMLYHLLIGDPPYEGTSSLSILQKHMHGDLPEIREKNDKIPEAIDAFIKATMAKAPADRPQTAAEAKALLDELQSEPMVVDLPKRRRRRRPPPPRPKGGASRPRRPGSDSGGHRPRPGSDSGGHRPRQEAGGASRPGGRRPPPEKGRRHADSERTRRPSDSERTRRRPPSEQGRRHADSERTRRPADSERTRRPSDSERKRRPPEAGRRHADSERTRRPKRPGKATGPARRPGPGAGAGPDTDRPDTRPAKRPQGVPLPAEAEGIPLSQQRTAAMDSDELREAARRRDAEQAEHAERGDPQFPPPRREAIGRVSPLPSPKRSKLLDVLAVLLLGLALAYGADAAVQQGEGKSPLADARERLAEGVPAATDLQKVEHAVAKLFTALEGKGWLLGLVAFLLAGDRTLARIMRYGPIGRFALNSRAKRLISGGEYHQAARVYEDIGDRLRAGDLLTQMNMHLLAAEFYRLGGYTELQAHALNAAGKGKEAIEVLRAAGSDAHTAIAAASLGDTSREAARLLQDQGMLDEAIAMHSRAGRHYEAAALLEQAGRKADAAQELEAGYAKDGGREYWHFTRKDGLLEQAKPKLAGRIAKLYMELGERASAAKYFERAGNPERAGELYRDVGDHRGRARCLLHGIPPKGRLSPEHRELLGQAADALAAVKDPQAIDLYVRAGNVSRAAELCRDQRDYPQAAQLFARANRHAEGAECAAKAGNRQLAAHLYSEGGDHRRAAEIFEKLGQLEEAADAARAGDDFSNQARLYSKLGRHLGAAQAWFRIGKGEEALVALQKVAKQTDEWSEAQILAAEVHFNAGRFREAASGYRELHPQIDLREEVGPTLRFATALTELGQFDEALKVLARFDKNKLAPRDLAKRKSAIRAKAGKATGGNKPRPAKRRAPGKDGLGATARAPDLIGQRLDRYEILEVLEEDAFTWVYRARHERLGRDAVLKVLKPAVNTGEAGQQFLEEGRNLIGKSCPHIVEVQDGGDARGLNYLVYEQVDGPSLAKLIADEAPLPIPRAATLGAGILDALQVAHEAGVVHYDLTPARIRVASGDKAKVADFGVARVFEELDGAGSYVDPRYASPEQSLGDDPGAPADLYGAALIIYELLTGQLPFSAKNPRGYWTLHANEKPTPIRELRKEVPRPLANAINRALSKSPNGRFADAAAFKKAIAAFAKG